MFDRRSWMMGVGCALALLAPSRVVGADGDQMFATVATPAIVTVKARTAIERLGSLRVVIVVTGFEPPRDGTVVEVVVKAQEEGTDTEREIGRFGIFPYTEFKVANPASGRRLTLPLPREFTGRPVKLTVQLVPLRGGEGQGARIRLAQAWPLKELAERVAQVRDVTAAATGAAAMRGIADTTRRTEAVPQIDWRDQDGPKPDGG